MREPTEPEIRAARRAAGMHDPERLTPDQAVRYAAGLAAKAEQRLARAEELLARMAGEMQVRLSFGDPTPPAWFGPRIKRARAFLAEKE